MAGKIYVAKTSAVVFLDGGGQVTLRGGVTRVREGHELLKGREHMFEEIGVHYDVETARQAPPAEATPEPVKTEAPEPEPEPVKAEAPKAPAKPQPRGRRKASGLTSDDTPGS